MFCRKSKFLPEIKIFVENQNFSSTIKIFVETQNFSSKIKFFVQNQNFCPKSKFLSKIKIFVQNKNFCAKKTFLRFQSFDFYILLWNFYRPIKNVFRQTSPKLFRFLMKCNRHLKYFHMNVFLTNVEQKNIFADIFKKWMHVRITFI